MIEFAECSIAMARDNFIKSVQHERRKCPESSEETPRALEVGYNEKRGSGAAQQPWRIILVVFDDIHVSESVGIPAITREQRASCRALKRREVKEAVRIAGKDFRHQPIAQPADSVVKDEMTPCSLYCLDLLAQYTHDAPNNRGQHAGISSLSKRLADAEGPSAAVFETAIRLAARTDVDAEIGSQQNERSLNPNAEAGAPTQVEDIVTM